MSSKITLSFTQDEAEILVDALDADHEGYVEAAKEARGNGTGRALMQEGIARCSQAWPDRGIRISAQAHLRGFYGSLGFEAVSDEYLEDDIPHIEMLRKAG